MPPARDLWIDALRAFLAIGVLHSHLMLHFPIDDVPFHRNIIDFLCVFRVPTFFFISGYILFLQIERYNGVPVSQIISKKFRQLLIPSIIFTLVPSFAEGFDLLTDLNTAHYFLPALFLIIVLFCALYFAIADFNKNTKCAILIFYALLTTVLMALFSHSPVKGYFHWRQALHGNIFFIIGVLCAMYKSKTALYAKKIYTPVILGTVYSVLYLILNNYLPGSKFDYLSTVLYRLICPIVGLLFISSVFACLSKYFTPSNFLGKLSFYIGQRTLSLYILQEIAFSCVFYLIEVNELHFPQIAAVFILILTSLFVLIFHDLICRSAIINKYVFGRKKPLPEFKDLTAAA